jgi:ATP-dependent RNA circularization protein (DNA/RNA ligase family)
MAPITDAHKEVRAVLKNLSRSQFNRLDHLNAIRSHVREIERGLRFYGERPEAFRLARIAAHTIALLAMEFEEDDRRDRLARDGSH